MSRPLISTLVLLGISLTFNALQGTRILRLEQTVDPFNSSQRLAEGTSLPSLDVKDKAGKRILIDYGSTSRPTLLYVLSPSCNWCRRNVAAFRALEKEIKNEVRLIGLSLSWDGTEAFIDSSGIDFPVYTPSESTVKSHHLGETPSTILVSKNGIVLKRWSGAYSGLTKRSIEDYFHVKLPQPD